MTIRTFLTASILAAAVVSAQTNLPASCQRASGLVATCTPSGGSVTNADTARQIAECLCGNNAFVDDIAACVQDAGAGLNDQIKASLDQYKQACAQLGSGGGFGTVSGSPSSVATSSVDDSATSTDGSGPAFTSTADDMQTTSAGGSTAVQTTLATSGGSGTTAGGAGASSTSAGTQSTGGSAPSSASGLKVAFFGTTLAAVFVGVAMLL